MNFTLTEAADVLQPLYLFVIGIVIYSLFTFKFYRFLAKKDIFHLDLQQYNTARHGSLKKIISFFFYIVKYLIVFPAFVFFWFAVLSLLLMLLSKSQETNQILLIAMGLVAAVRMTSYYSEDLSRDLAKMMPFALLGVFLVDASYFSLDRAIVFLETLPQFISLLVYYFISIILLEFVMRIFYGALSLFKKEKLEKVN